MSIEIEDGTLRIQQIIAAADAEIRSTQVSKDIDLEIDPGNLAVVDVNFLDEASIRNPQTVEDVLLPIARDSIQLLMRDIYNLKRANVDNMAYAIMPPPSSVLPREKPVPGAPPMTKWEKYAKEKGIKKKKKENKIWDDTAQDFVPRYGRLKVQIDKDKNWVMEVPRQSNPFEDQFKKAANAKKERIAKNEFQRLRNIARDRKNATPGVGVMRTDTKDVSQLKKAMHFSRYATASLGKFQPILKDEVTVKGFKKNSQNESDKPMKLSTVQLEKKKALKIVDNIWKPQVNTDTNIIKQIEKDLAAEEIHRKKNLKSDRRSKRGGRLSAKSGAAIASLTDGKRGDKTSVKRYKEKKEEASGGSGKVSKKKNKGRKSLFGGTKGKNKSFTSIVGGKIKKKSR